MNKEFYFFQKKEKGNECLLKAIKKKKRNVKNKQQLN